MYISGSTAMAEAGAVPELIKGTGQWGSTSVKWYICVVLYSEHHRYRYIHGFSVGLAMGMSMGSQIKTCDP